MFLIVERVQFSVLAAQQDHQFFNASAAPFLLSHIESGVKFDPLKMGIRLHKWIDVIRKFPQSETFIDSRIIHAPPDVVRQLLDDYRLRNIQLKQVPQAREQSVKIWINKVIRLLRNGKPELEICSIEQTETGVSRTRIRAGFKPDEELALASAAIMLWVTVWLGWGLLLCLREKLLQGGTFESVGPALPITAISVPWLFCYTRFWKTSFRPVQTVNQFYEHLTKDCGVFHRAESPLAFPWSGFVQILITGMGLIGICIQMSTFVRPHDRMILSSVVAIPYAIVLFGIFSVKNTVRWLTGKAAFAATIALSLYVLFPLILWALEADDSSQISANNSSLQSIGGWAYVKYFFLILLGLGGSLFVLTKVTFEATTYASAIDYWRSHPESQNREGGWPRFSLLILVILVGFISSGLFWLGFMHSITHLISLVFGSCPWGESIVFERASKFIGTIVCKTTNLVSINPNPQPTGGWLILLFTMPVLAWGGCHVTSFLVDICHYIRIMFQSRPHLRPEIQAARACLCRKARILPPLMRLENSPQIFACVIISPLPFLPHIVLISAGAFKHLPPNSLVAVLAHEIGHLRHGHTQVFAILRILSRCLLLGPSFLTGLIRPPITLEAQADAFAVACLETTGRSREDLMDALRLMEQQQIMSAIPQNLTKGVSLMREAQRDWMPNNLRRLLAGDTTNYVGRRAFNCWLLYYHLIFNSDLVGYVYVPLSIRLNLISSLPPARLKP